MHEEFAPEFLGEEFLLDDPEETEEETEESEDEDEAETEGKDEEEA